MDNGFRGSYNTAYGGYGPGASPNPGACPGSVNSHGFNTARTPVYWYPSPPASFPVHNHQPGALPGDFSFGNYRQMQFDPCSFRQPGPLGPSGRMVGQPPGFNHDSYGVGFFPAAAPNALPIPPSQLPLPPCPIIEAPPVNPPRYPFPPKPQSEFPRRC